MNTDRFKRAAAHPVTRNVLALGSVQAAQLLVPLITLPFLARVLSRTDLGLVVIVQSFSFMVALLVDYGFALSATREVARARDRPKELAQVVAEVMGAKALLSALATTLSLPVLILVPLFADSPTLWALGVGLGITQGFMPTWFWLGLERAPLAALIDLTTRLLSLVLIIVAVTGSSDGQLVLVIYLMASATSTLVLSGLMYRKVGLAGVGWRGATDALRRGWTLFVGTGAVALYTGANAFILGLIVPASSVALFAAAEKVVRAGSRVLGLTAQAVYPRVSILLSRGSVERANRLSALSIGSFAFAATVIAAFLAAFAPTIVDVVFGPKFEGAVDLMRILALLLPFNVIGVALSTQWLLPRGLDRLVTRVVVLAMVLNAVLLVAATELLGLTASAWACVAVEVFVMSGNLLSVRSARHGDAALRASGIDTPHPEVASAASDGAP